MFCCSALALVLGFALMGFEMLGSRYLYPYFGGGINTWASLIATVLVALMLGYLLGGALVDRTMSPRLCGILLVVAGVYLFTIPLWVDPLFAWMLDSVGDGMAGIILAADGPAAPAADADERVHAVRGAPAAHLGDVRRSAGRLRLRRLDHRQCAWHAGRRPSCWCRCSARARSPWRSPSSPSLCGLVMILSATASCAGIDA